jgi:integrase
MDNELIFSDDGARPWRQERLKKARYAILGMADVDALSFNDFRHLHATMSLEAGETPDAVARRLGHADVGTTLNVYADVVPGSERDALVNLEEKINAS